MRERFRYRAGAEIPRPVDSIWIDDIKTGLVGQRIELAFSQAHHAPMRSTPAMQHDQHRAFYSRVFRSPGCIEQITPLKTGLDKAVFLNPAPRGRAARA